MLKVLEVLRVCKVPGALEARALSCTAVLLTLAVAGCSQLGSRDRVLHRVPSPDGSMLAVCQEVPEFDGPGYDVRLERKDGTVIRRLYAIGDGDPCSEMAWSPDGRQLAVLSAHVARLRIVDVERALAEASVPAAQVRRVPMPRRHG